MTKRELKLYELYCKFLSTASATASIIADKLDKKMHKEYKKFKIARNYGKLRDRKSLTKEQKKEIQDFYQELIGEKVSLYSHEYFYSRSGKYTKEYVPMELYYLDLIPKANDLQFFLAYGDKNITDILFPNEKQPHTYLKNVNGYFYFEGQSITQERAECLCQNLGEVIIKPSLTAHGHGVRLINVENGIDKKTGDSVSQIFKRYKSDYIIQEKIRQHELMSALNPTSVNTLRILTYRSETEVLLIYSVIRIGRNGQIIDNQGAGGLSTTIDANGKLGKFSFGGSATDNIEKTDTGVVLEGYQVPSYDKAIEMVKRLHLGLPYFKIIGWDIAIDESGAPVLVEFNTKRFFKNVFYLLL